MQSFDLPAMLDEVRGQPVEEFGVGWLVALGAEIVRCFDNPFSEVRLPDAIDDDARGQRVVITGDPFSQSESPSGDLIGDLPAIVWFRIGR